METPKNNRFDEVVEKNKESLSSLGGDIEESDLSVQATAAAKTNPGAFAESYNISQELGVSTAAVEAKKEDALKAIEQKRFSSVSKSYAGTSRFLENPDYARLAKDNLDHRTGLEQFFINLGTAYTESDNQKTADKLTAESTFRQLTPIEEATRRRIYNTPRTQINKDNAGGAFISFAEVLPSSLESFGGVVGGGTIASGLSGAATLAVTKNPAQAINVAKQAWKYGAAVGGFATSYKQIYGNAVHEFESFKDKDGNPIDRQVAIFAAAAVATPASLLDVVSLGKVAKMFPGADKIAGKILTRQVVKAALSNPTTYTALKKAASRYAKGIAAEGATEAAQEFIQIIGGEVAKSISPGEYESISEKDIADRVYGAWETATQATAAGGLLGLGATSYVESKNQNNLKAQQEKVKQVGDLATSDPLLKRSPQAAEAHAQEVLRDHPDKRSVYVDAGAFTEYFQSVNLDQQAVARELDVGEQLEAAREIGGDLVIPFEKYYSKVAGNEHHQGLSQDVRFTAGELSVRELTEFDKESVAAEMRSMVDKNVEAAKDMTKMEESAEKVRRDVEAKLMAAGRGKVEANRTAQLYKARYMTMAERRGENANPFDLYKKRNLKFEKRKDGVARKGEMGQANLSSENLKAWFGDSKIIDEKGQPKVVYHGSPNVFETFDFSKLKGGAFGKGFYFSNTPDVANGRTGTKGKKYDVYLSIKNPYVINMSQDKSLGDTGLWDAQQKYGAVSTFKEKMKADGYDGIVIHKGAYTEYVAFDPEQIKSVDNQGTYDTNNPNIYKQDRRGSILFGDDETVISFFKNADASTVIHETGHAWLQEVADDIKAGVATEQEKKDFEAVLRWLGSENADSLTEAQIEQYARGWEAYVFEGQSPSQALARVFAAFKKWLTNIYNAVLGLNVELNDEVRGVFDRMLATDVEIEQAAGQPVNEPLFKSEADAKVAKMTREKYEAYLRINKSSLDRAGGEILAKAVRRVWGERVKSYRKIIRDTRAQVEAETETMPVFWVKDFIRNGGTFQKKNGEVVDVERMKLNRTYVEKIFKDSQEVLELLGDKYLSRDGVNPDELAAITNYRNGIDLINDMVNYPEREEWVKQETNRRVAEAFDISVFTQDNLEAAAFEALQNDERFELLESELRALSDLAQKKTVDTVALKNYAKQAIVGLEVTAISPNRYLAKANKHAALSQRYFAQRNYAKALEARKNQLANMYLHREAVEARRAYDKGLRYMKKMSTSQSRRARLGKVLNGFLEQVDAILGRFGVAKQTLFPAESLRAWHEARVKEGDPIVIADSVLDDSASIPYDEMRFKEFTDVINALKSIEQAARQRTEVKTKTEQLTFEEAENRIVESLQKNFKKLFDKQGNPRKSKDNSWAGKVGRFARGVRDSIIKPEYEIVRLDGDEKLGPLWRLIYSPVNEASKERVIRNAKEAARLAKALSPFGNMRFQEQVFVKELGMSKTRGELIAAAMNMGNKYNYEALLDGEKWTKEQAEAVKAALSKTDWDYVQAWWDFIGFFRDEIAVESRSQTGVEMEFVEAEPVQTPYGIYKGGYFPVKFDSDESTRAAELEQATDIGALHAGAIIAPGTVKGFTIERQGTQGRPLLLDPNVGAKHITDVVNYLTVHRAIRQTDRLLQRPKVKSAIETVAGVQFSKNIRQWLLDVANDRPPPAWGEKEVRKLRSNITIATMAWKFSVAVQQVLGTFTTLSQVNVKHVASSFSQLYNPATRGAILQRIWERSVEVKNRVELGDRDVRDALKTVTGNEFSDKAKRTFFLVTGLIDREIATMTWLAAHYQAAEKGLNEVDAIDYADQTVRETQASGLTKDLSSIQRQGGLARMLTMFYSFFNALYGLTEREIRMLKNGKVTIAHFAAFMTLNYILPSVVSELISNRGPGEDADEDEWLKWFLSQELSYPLATIPVIGPLGRNAAQRFFANGYSSDSILAVESIPYRTMRLAGNLGQGIRGDKDWEDVTPKIAKDIIYLSGYGFGLPASQIDTTLSAVGRIMDGEEVQPQDILLRPNPKARE